VADETTKKRKNYQNTPLQLSVTVTLSEPNTVETDSNAGHDDDVDFGNAWPVEQERFTHPGSSRLGRGPPGHLVALLVINLIKVKTSDILNLDSVLKGPACLPC